LRVRGAIVRREEVGSKGAPNDGQQDEPDAQGRVFLPRQVWGTPTRGRSVPRSGRTCPSMFCLMPRPGGKQRPWGPGALGATRARPIGASPAWAACFPDLASEARDESRPPARCARYRRVLRFVERSNDAATRDKMHHGSRGKRRPARDAGMPRRTKRHADWGPRGRGTPAARPSPGRVPKMTGRGAPVGPLCAI